MPKVVVEDTGQTFEVAEGSILYDAVADQGVELPHGCLSGSCGACRIHVLKGAENLAPAGLIENNTVDCIRQEYAQGPESLAGKTVRLSCRAKVMGDVTIVPLNRKK